MELVDETERFLNYFTISVYWLGMCVPSHFFIRFQSYPGRFGGYQVKQLYFGTQFSVDKWQFPSS